MSLRFPLISIYWNLKKVVLLLCLDGFMCSAHVECFVYQQVETNGDADPGVLLSAQTITSETTSTTTTTHITKVRAHLLLL